RCGRVEPTSQRAGELAEPADERDDRPATDGITVDQLRPDVVRAPAALQRAGRSPAARLSSARSSKPRWHPADDAPELDRARNGIACGRGAASRVRSCGDALS